LGFETFGQTPARCGLEPPERSRRSPSASDPSLAALTCLAVCLSLFMFSNRNWSCTTALVVRLEHCLSEFHPYASLRVSSFATPDATTSPSRSCVVLHQLLACLVCMLSKKRTVAVVRTGTIHARMQPFLAARSRAHVVLRRVGDIYIDGMVDVTCLNCPKDGCSETS